MTTVDLEAVLRARYVERAAHQAPAALHAFVHAIPESQSRVNDGLAPTGVRVTGARVAKLAAAALLVAVLGATWAALGSRPGPPLTFAPDTIAFSRDGDLYLLPPDGSDTPTWAASGGGWGLFQVAFAPDGRHIAYSRFTGDGIESYRDDTEVAVMAADGRTVGSYVGRFETQLAWAPDSRRIAVLGDDDSSAIIGLDGQVLSGLALPAGWMTTYVSATEWVSWSPDGRSIAVPGCARPCEAKHELDFVLAAADGSGWRSSHPDDPAPLGPGSIAVWSPDSTLALIRRVDASGRYGVQPVETRTADGELLHEVDLPVPSTARSAAWSPDGSTLAVVGRGPEAKVVLIDADGSSRSIVTDPAFDAFGGIAWSADGSSLVFEASPTSDGTWSLWTMSAEGGSARHLIDDVDAFAVNWALAEPSTSVAEE